MAGIPFLEDCVRNGFEKLEIETLLAEHARLRRNIATLEDSQERLGSEVVRLTRELTSLHEVLKVAPELLRRVCSLDIECTDGCPHFDSCAAARLDFYGEDDELVAAMICEQIKASVGQLAAVIEESLKHPPQGG